MCEFMQKKIKNIYNIDPTNHSISNFKLQSRKKISTQPLDQQLVLGLSLTVRLNVNKLTFVTPTW